MSDPNGFRQMMAEARHHLLVDPAGAGEDRARGVIRRFLSEAETPAAVLDLLAEALLDAAYRGRWELGRRATDRHGADRRSDRLGAPFAEAGGAPRLA